MADLHPRLVPLLAKHGVTHALFTKRGRLPKGFGHVLEARKAIVTELHQAGTKWVDLLAITGLSQGSIQRLTGAMWNPASRNTVRETCRVTGRAGKGKARPGQLEAQWRAGTFDFHRGRKRSEQERQNLLAGWTSEKREGQSKRSQALWADPEVRNRLLTFHRSESEGARRSELQTKRMKNTPGKYAKGRSQWVDTPKGATPRSYVRSTYEVAAVKILEADPQVVSYEFEYRVVLPTRKWILIDFVVQYEGKPLWAVEVKPQWILDHPTKVKERARLELARQVADSNGWGFSVWTEKDLKDAL